MKSAVFASWFAPLVLANDSFHESFNPLLHRWYNSRLTQQFDFDAGLNPSDFIDEYGLYAKYAGKYAISSVLDYLVGPFPIGTNKKGLKVSFENKTEQLETCGETLLHLYTAADFLPDMLTPETPSILEFGPYICRGVKQMIVRFRQHTDGPLFELKKIVPVYNTKRWVKYELAWSTEHYSISIDNEVVEKGRIADDFASKLAGREFIEDSDAQKPEDWVENPYLISDDVLALLETTPEWIPDYQEEDSTDDLPSYILNPEWESLQRMIKPNPDYSGKWQPPLIKNPQYISPDNITGELMEAVEVVGITVITQEKGVLVDDISLKSTDDLHFTD